MDGDERFSLVSDRLAIKMSGLTNSEWKLFALLLQKIKRKPYKASKTREPTEKSKLFNLTYQEFKRYGMPSASFDLAIAGLIRKGFIKVDGKYNNKICKILAW